MPNSIQAEIQKAITGFVWGKERATMCIKDVVRNPEQGGRKIMNITRWNEAIDLMWVKQYLDMEPDQPKWAFMMDKIFRMEWPKWAKETHQMNENWNPLIQDWKLKVRSTCIPKRVHNTMRLARKHGVELEALEPTYETRHKIPVWLHRKANKEAAQLYMTDRAKCLKNKHCMHYMRQLMELIGNIPDEH